MTLYPEPLVSFTFTFLFSFPLPPSPPLQFNPEQKGFYRVNYPSDMLAALTEAIPSLPPSDRLGLLDEAFALVI